ncbi:MAG TPA: hypothetical protein VFX30_08235 [bacterium]|nr:hypothetical protein [bacterium]
MKKGIFAGIFLVALTGIAAGCGSAKEFGGAADEGISVAEPQIEPQDATRDEEIAPGNAGAPAAETPTEESPAPSPEPTVRPVVDLTTRFSFDGFRRPISLPAAVAGKFEAAGPHPTVRATAFISSEKPELTLVLQYKNLDRERKPSIPNCVAPNLSFPTSDGSGDETVTCPLNTDVTRIDFSFPGVGANNVTTESFVVRCDAPEITLRETGYTNRDGDTLCSVDEDGWSRSCDLTGYLGLEGSITRTCRVERSTDGDAFEMVSERKVPWVGDLKLETIGGDGATCDEAEQTISVEDGRTVVAARAKRNHFCKTYDLISHDVDGRRLASAVLRAPYEADLEITGKKALRFIEGTRAGASFSWEGRHLKRDSVQVACEDNFGTSGASYVVHPGEADGSSYDGQTGTVRIDYGFQGDPKVFDGHIRCRITAKDYSGNELSDSVIWKFNWWTIFPANTIGG